MYINEAQPIEAADDIDVEQKALMDNVTHDEPHVYKSIRFSSE